MKISACGKGGCGKSTIVTLLARELAARGEEVCVRLTVEDDGIGIAKDDLEKIFRRFYQADNSRTGAGTGLGLSMVREIAKFHGGEVFAESELGVGSKFTCVFQKN